MSTRTGWRAARIRRWSVGSNTFLEGHTLKRAVVAESGVQVQVEVQAFWDTPRQPGNLRVIIAIDDGGWRSFRPLSTDFIIASDGSFVGE